MRSCERPLKRSASEASPSSVSNRYSLSIRTHGSSCRRRASSSLRRVSSFSALSSSSRAVSHSVRVPVMCFVIVVIALLPLPLGVLHRSCLDATWRFWSEENPAGPARRPTVRRSPVREPYSSAGRHHAHDQLAHGRRPSDRVDRAIPSCEPCNGSASGDATLIGEYGEATLSIRPFWFDRTTR